MDFKDLVPFGRERRNVPVQRGRTEHPVEMFQQEVNRLFDDFFQRPSLFGGSDRAFATMPRIDVSENEREYEVTAELPGMEEKDLEITLADNMLAIRGEKKESREEKDKSYYVSERTFGTFRRTIPLPTEVEADKVEAHFKNGVLTVRLPKSPEAQARTRRIEVKAA